MAVQTSSLARCDFALERDRQKVSSLSPPSLVLGTNHEPIGSFSTLLLMKGKECLHEVLHGKL